MGLSMWQIALVVLVFILLFGRGKIPSLMTDIAQGIKGFKEGIKDEKTQESSVNPEQTESTAKSISDKP